MVGRAFAGLLLMLVLPAPGASQTAREDTGHLELTREELTRVHAELEAVVNSEAHSSETREQARANIAAVSQRLADGDFRVGDRVILDIAGEPNMPDTLLVEPGPAIAVPTMGRISLAGVLRSELHDHLMFEISRYLQLPRFTSISLIRLSIQGEVSNPGFYTVPADMLLGDVLMVAGGPTNNSTMDKVRVERRPDVLWPHEDLRSAIVEDRTLDQLNLRAGDQIVVPANTGNRYLQAFQLVAAGVAITLLGQSVFSF